MELSIQYQRTCEKPGIAWIAYANGQSMIRVIVQTSSHPGKIKLLFTIYIESKLGLEGSSYAIFPVESRIKKRLCADIMSK